MPKRWWNDEELWNLSKLSNIHRESMIPENGWGRTMEGRIKLVFLSTFPSHAWTKKPVSHIWSHICFSHLDSSRSECFIFVYWKLNSMLDTHWSHHTCLIIEYMLCVYVPVCVRNIMLWGESFSLKHTLLSLQQVNHMNLAVGKLER